MAEPIRKGGGSLELLGDVDRLVGFTPRAGGTDAERRAARYLAARLEELGRSAHTEPIRIWPAFAPALLLIAIAGVTGSVLTVSVHLAGFLVVLLAAITAFGELSGSFFLARLHAHGLDFPVDSSRPGGPPD